MITLDGFELSESLIWTDRRMWSPVLQTVRMTIGGNLNIFSEPTMVKRPVTLIANENQGWLTPAMVTKLEDLAANVHQVYIFNYHDLEVLNVMFKHEEPPALELKPLVDGGELGEWFTGTIKLFTL